MYLRQQLDSLIAQTFSDWAIYASDDGSVDETREILLAYQRQLGKNRMVIFDGPQQGFAKNFMSLIKNATIISDYYAFSDQDDVWFPDKLERSLAHLKDSPADVPAMFCSRTRLIDADGHIIGFSPLFKKKPSFRNALVQSLAGANTMLLNQVAKALLAQTHDDAHIVSHDWLTYLLVSGSDGKVVYDPLPTLDYRQHGANLIGSNSGLADRWVRVRKMFAGTFRDWTEHNLNALGSTCERFTKDNRKALAYFKKSRESSFIARVYLLKKAGVYRQTPFGTIGLIVAASIRRI
ncbi:glycosyltransferase family 2 protein [Stutzerimonas urumqiensis]|uniref:glycosyltransferase family 2 protein n=1 Tax=Stutzerimonas urumqiensis TaxID=638269 RepID=UPI003BAD1602